MKNLFKFLSLCILASVVAFGCANTSSDAVLDSSAGAKTANKTITLVATGDAKQIEFPVEDNGIAKSIMADTITATTLKYYLFTKNKVTNASTNPTAPLTFTASADAPNIGTVPLTIADGYYEFKLYATQDTPAALTEDGVKTVALFLGQTEADLRTSTDTVTFYLTSDTLTGSADVAIKLMTTGWTVPTGYTMTAGITKKTDGSVVGTPATLTTISSITATEPASAQFTKTGVTAGTYNFEVNFTNAGGTKTYTWSDPIIIAANHDIAQTVKIPQVLDMPPAAPTDFNAVFKDADTTSAGYYNVEFDWKAEDSVNEAYFQIELLEVPSSTAWASINADTSTEWDDDYRTTLGNVGSTYMTTLGKDFYGNESQNWVSGSLRKNNTTATVALPLGKRYLARIAAVNDAGPSEYCYIDFDNANVPATLTTGYAKFYAASKVVNRYRLTYNLVGGTVTKADDTTSTDDIVEYRTENDTARATAGTYVPAAITSNLDVPTAAIWDPANDTTPYKSLKQGARAWTNWRLGSSSSATLYDSDPASSPYSPPDYTGCEDLVLYASYSPTSAAVNILDDNDWSIAVANFTGTAPSGTGVTADDLEAKQQIELDLGTSGAGAITWTIAYTTAQTNAKVAWDRVTYTIKKAGETFNKAGPIECSKSGATGWTTSTDFSSYTEGNYLVTFNAYPPHKTEPYAQTIVVVVSSN